MPQRRSCRGAVPALAGNAAVTVTIDPTANRHAINPQIYGVAFGSKSDLKTLNAPLNRMGGNSMTAYNWKQNATNLAQDWYFESYPQDGGDTAGALADSFVSDSKAQGAAPMLTVPLAGWVAKLGANRSILPAFSVAKYGAQCDVDPYDNDAGDGIMTDCSTPIAGNDPHDAYIADSTALERKWVHHLIKTWGRAKAGGVGYYLMDNEPSIWFSTHRDIHPVGPHATEYRDKVIAESASIKSLDPNAKIVAPEEWGWEAYFYSGYDQQYAAAHGYCCWPDHDGLQGGMDYIPWLLSQWKSAGHPVDVLSVHFYPQGAEDSNDVSTATQLLRNRSTRQLWDPNYTSESWIDAPVYLIPRLKGWIGDNYYAGHAGSRSPNTIGARRTTSTARRRKPTSTASSAARASTWRRAGRCPTARRRPSRRCRCIATMTARARPSATSRCRRACPPPTTSRPSRRCAARTAR